MLTTRRFLPAHNRIKFKCFLLGSRRLISLARMNKFHVFTYRRRRRLEDTSMRRIIDFAPKSSSIDRVTMQNELSNSFLCCVWTQSRSPNDRTCSSPLYSSIHPSSMFSREFIRNFLFSLLDIFTNDSKFIVVIVRPRRSTLPHFNHALMR